MVSERAALDDIDLKILALLRSDGRRSARSLAREIGMSAGAISDRVARLERTGAIRGYFAEIDPQALGYLMKVFIGVQVRQGQEVSSAMTALLKVPEVASVNMLTGAWDLLVSAQVRNHHHLREAVLNEIWNIPGFHRSETMIVFDYQKSGVSPSPLDRAWRTEQGPSI